MTIHVVQPGQTLYSIAGQYGVDPELLRRANGVPENGALAVGQTLVIQTIRVFHVVQPGQTLASIARQYGVSQRALYRNNYWLMGDPALQPGQTLVIHYREEKLGGIYTNGYAYPFIRPRELSAVLPYMSYVTPFTYGITAQGGLLPLDDGRILSEAARLGSAPLMHLSTLTEDDSFSSERAVQLLSDPQRQEELITQIEAIVAQKGYQGVDVDFEYIPGTQREAYAAFIERLRERLSPLPVLVALAPKTRADQPGLLYEGHDYALLGAAADYVLLMTYEWGYTYGPPMAVAPINKVREVVEYAVTEIPREKIDLGIPNYGYDWTLPFVQGTSRARSIGNVEAVRIAVENDARIEFDQIAMSPFFHYEKEGVEHEVWFEDVRSMKEKFHLVTEYGLRGVGYWQIMRLFRANWLLLDDLFDITKL